MVNTETQQFYLNLIVNKFCRSGYIYKPDLSGRDWRHTKFYLNDELIYRFLDDELMIGQKMAQNKKGETWTDRIIIDLDAPEEQFVPMLEVMKEAGQEYPSLLFRSSESGHLHAYYLIEKNIQGENLEVLQTYFNVLSKDKGIKRIEVFPKKGNGIRLPLGKGSRWCRTTSGEVITNDKSEAINEIYTSWTDLPKMDRYSLIGKLFQFAEETTVSNELNTKKHDKIIISKSGTLWKREKHKSRTGLTDYGQRNEAVLRLSAENFNSGLSLLESIANIKDWCMETQNVANSKDIQKAVSTGNWKQIERECESHYKRYERTFDPAKRKNSGGKIKAVSVLSDSELEEASKIAFSITGDTKRRHRQKASEFERILNAIAFIWIQSRDRSEGGFGWRSPESHKVARISKSLFERAGVYRRSGRFDPIQRLIQAGLIEIHLKGYGSPTTPGKATVYRLNFSLKNLHVSKNIKLLSSFFLINNSRNYS